ncbi:MAG: imidazole glycerol phosphate synthase subunit HisH, partial [Actinomycetota bacterium]
MQMLFDASDEDPHDTGLGVIPGRVCWITDALPRPQMQWNRLDLVAHDPVFDGLGEHPWVYFVHSLHGVPADPSVVAATCDYGGTVNAVFRRRNVLATQFHPEKSGASGLAMLANWVSALVPA